jgi:hypothetical protein
MPFIAGFLSDLRVSSAYSAVGSSYRGDLEGLAEIAEKTIVFLNARYLRPSL